MSGKVLVGQCCPLTLSLSKGERTAFFNGLLGDGIIEIGDEVELDDHMALLVGLGLPEPARLEIKSHITLGGQHRIALARSVSCDAALDTVSKPCQYRNRISAHVRCSQGCHPPVTNVEHSGRRESAARFWRGPTCLVGGCVLLWWARIWWFRGDQIDPFFNLDALMYWAPLLRQTAAQWRAGIVPLWNPYQALGSPLLATLQVAACYPLNALYLLLGVGWAWVLTGVLHHLIATGGMYVFCRRLDLSEAGSIVGAITFSFSGLVVGKYLDQPEFICLAWLPVLFAAAERLMVAPSFSATATLAGVWALQILGGHPETIAQSALLLAAYIAARLSSLAASAPLHALVAGVGSLTAAALALALSAFQWLPTLELLPHSVRAVGALTFTQQITLSAEPWRLATGPAGRMPLALALVGLWTWRRHAVAWFLATAAAVLLLLSTGPATPLFAMFRHLPTGTWFRAPTRFLNLWPLCIAVLAAAGVDGLLLPTRDRLRRVQIVAASALTLAALRVSLADRSDWARLLLVIGVFDVLPLLAVSTLISARAQRPASTGVWHFRSILVLAVICAAPGFYLQRYMSPLQLDGVYQQYGDLFRELRRQSPARVLSLLPFAGASSWAKLGTYFEVPVLNDLEPLSLADFRTFSDLLRGDGRSGLEALFTTFMGETAPPREHFDPRMLNLSGVRFILTSSHVQTPLAKWFGPEIHLVPWRRSDSAVVYENRSALPRAFFIPSSDAYPTPPRCIDALRAPQFDPRHDLLLDHVSPSVSLESGNAPNRVDILDYAPNRVRLAVTTGVSGFVVLTDAFYPGWTASLDHSNAPVLRADCFFRAVRTSAGTHEIVFQYAPWSFTVGTVVSAAALVAMVTLGTNGRRRARRRVLSQTADERRRQSR